MWLIGTIVLLIAGAAVTTAVGWTPRTTPGPPLWDITKLAGINVGASGTFAGFSLTAAIFIAGLDFARTSPTFATVFGMMLIGFLILIAAAWIFGSAPSALPAEDATAPSLALVLGNLCSNLGVTITWLALAPLMRVIGLSALADAFTWALLAMVVLGGTWVALCAYYLALPSVRSCLAIPALGLALPALYRLVAVRVWPALWPTGDAALPFAFVALSAAILTFVLHLGLLVARNSNELQQRLRQGEHRIVLVIGQVHVMLVALIWFAVAVP
jgi:hypothetical protein